jgi:hypothetical protein
MKDIIEVVTRKTHKYPLPQEWQGVLIKGAVRTLIQHSNKFNHKCKESPLFLENVYKLSTTSTNVVRAYLNEIVPEYLVYATADLAIGNYTLSMSKAIIDAVLKCPHDRMQVIINEALGIKIDIPF